MSSSRQVSDSVMHAAAKAPVKSNFLQTCNLLSRYIKEKGSLRDLNLEIGGKVESLDAIVKPGSSLSASTTATANSNSQENHEKAAKETLSEQRPFIDLSSQTSGPDSSTIITIEDSSNKTSASKEGATMTTEPKPSQLTIFYSGRVLVFDDYPADKARELVSVAKRSSSQMSYGTLPNTTQHPHSRKQPVGILSNASSKEKSIPTTNSSPSREGLPPRPQPAGGKDKAKASAVGTPEAAGSKTLPEQASPPQSEASGSDLPIARRSSLHRFLEKRKDRAAARGPYQHQQHQDNGGANDSSSSAKGNEHLDLNL